MLGEEYLPMDGSDWTSIISELKIDEPRRPDHLDRRRRSQRHPDQAVAAAGMKIPYGNLAVDEGTAKTMGADADRHVHLAAPT